VGGRTTGRSKEEVGVARDWGHGRGGLCSLLGLGGSGKSRYSYWEGMTNGGTLIFSR